MRSMSSAKRILLIVLPFIETVLLKSFKHGFLYSVFCEQFEQHSVCSNTLMVDGSWKVYITFINAVPVL